MRAVLLILDGEAVAGEGGDLLAALDGAQTPHLDRLGMSGRVGAAATTPGGKVSAAHGLLTLLGYDEPSVGRPSPAVFRASARGVDFRPGDWAMRAALVGVSTSDDDGILSVNTGVSREESDALFGDLTAHWNEVFHAHMERVRIIGDGVSRLFIDRDGPSYAHVEMPSPQIADGEPWLEHLPDGGEPLAADRLCTLVSASRHFLAEHPINVARAEQGLTPANLVWMWDAGTAGLPLLAEHLPARVALLADSDEVAGAGRLVGLDAVGTGEIGTLAGRITAMLAGAEAEIVCAVVSDTAQRVDAEVVGPLVEAMGDPEAEPWRVLVSASHDPQGGPAPFVLAGSWVRSVVPRRLCDGVSSDLRVDPGCELLEYVLRSGMRGRV